MTADGGARGGGVQAGGVWSAYRNVLRRRNFMMLWLGQTVSWFGDSLYFVSLLWLVQELTGSRVMVGVVAACRTFPQLLQVFSGAVVDRVDRRKMMLYSDLARAGIVLLIPVFHVFGLLHVWHVPAVAFLLATVGVFFFPARSALVPVIIEREELTQANSLMTLSQQFTFVVGYAIAGLMIALLGVMPIFVIDSVTFLVSVAAIASLRLAPEQTRPSRAGRDGAAGTAAVLRQDLAEGFRFILRSPAMVAVLPLAVALNFLFAPFGVLLPAWVTDVLGAGPSMFGFLETATTAGMALGTLVVGLLVVRYRRSLLTLSGVIVMGGATVAFSLARGVPLPLAAMAVSGFVNAIVNIIVTTWLQTVTPREMLGRVFGATGTASMIAAPAGQAAAGILGDLMPLPLLFGATGVLSALIGTVYWIVPGLRRVFDLIELETANGSGAASEAGPATAEDRNRRAAHSGT